SSIRPSVVGYCNSAPITPGRNSKLAGSATTVWTPRASARVRTTAIVCGWHASAIMNTGVTPAGGRATASVRCIASAAAVAASSREALVMGRAVRSSSIARVSSGLGPMWRVTKRSAGSREARAVGMLEGLFANMLLVLLAPQQLVELFRTLHPEPDHPALAVGVAVHDGRVICQRRVDLG